MAGRLTLLLRAPRGSENGVVEKATPPRSGEQQNVLQIQNLCITVFSHRGSGETHGLRGATPCGWGPTQIHRHRGKSGRGGVGCHAQESSPPHFCHREVLGCKEVTSPTEKQLLRGAEKNKGITNRQIIHNRNAQRARVSSRAEWGATTPATAGTQAVEEWVPIAHGPRPCDPALRHHRQKRF